MAQRDCNGRKIRGVKWTIKMETPWYLNGVVIFLLFLFEKDGRIDHSLRGDYGDHEFHSRKGLLGMYE